MAIGASSTPTRYRIRVSHGEVSVKCGPDILLNGLREDLEGEANCPVCERSIRFTVKDSQVRDLQPSRAIVHVVETVEGPGRSCVACEASHIFDREECLKTWLSKYAGVPGSTYSLQGYMEHVLTAESKEIHGPCGTAAPFIQLGT